MRSHGAEITFEQYLERERIFTEALRLSRQEKWQEAERLYRQLTERSKIPCLLSKSSSTCTISKPWSRFSECLSRS